MKHRCAALAPCVLMWTSNDQFDRSPSPSVAGRQCFSSARAACRDRRCACPHSRSHRLFDHRRGRSARRPLCLRRHRDGDCIHWRSSGNDLRRDRCRGRAGYPTRPGSRRRISLRRDHIDGPHPDGGRLGPSRPVDAVRVTVGHHRLCECLGDPDLHGPAAAADRCDVASLCHGRCRTGDHLSPSANSPRRCLHHWLRSSSSRRFRSGPRPP